MTKHIIDSELIRRIIGKMNMVWQKTDETEELRAILAQPAADCGLEVVAWRIGLPTGYKVYEQRQPWAYEQYGTFPFVTYDVQELVRKSDADARDAMRLERIAELEAAITSCLPCSYYMDLPDGGSPSLEEQLRRMAKDAADLRAAEHRLKEVASHCATVEQELAELKAQISDPDFPPKYARRLIAELRDRVAELEEWQVTERRLRELQFAERDQLRAELAVLNESSVTRHWKEAAERLGAELDALKAQEPIGVQHRKPIVYANGDLAGYSDWQDGSGLGFWPHRKIYAAPVAKQEVVMPERMVVPMPIWKDARQPYGDPLNAVRIGETSHFNLALDEVARLNEGKPNE